MKRLVIIAIAAIALATPVHAETSEIVCGDTGPDIRLGLPFGPFQCSFPLLATGTYKGVDRKDAPDDFEFAMAPAVKAVNKATAAGRAC